MSPEQTSEADSRSAASDTTDPPHGPPEGARYGRLRKWATRGLVAGLLLVLLHILGVLAPVEQSIVERLPDRPTDALLGIVDVFRCCILSWQALTTMLPAFLLGGAIAAFVPTSLVLRYMGAGANRVVAYTSAALSGILLSLCSCNIVPLFVSIYRRGAGTGPAFAFLYAGPAINVVAMVFTVQVIGWQMGIWRGLAVPLIAVVVGAIMALLFRREDRARAEVAATHTRVAEPAADKGMGRLGLLVVVLMSMVIFGAWDTNWVTKLIGMAGIVAALGILLWRLFDREEVAHWMGETWGLVKLVVPVLIPAVLVIGAIAAYMDIKVVYRALGTVPDSAGFLQVLRPIVIGDIFGALMYFPILSEVAFTKAFLKLGMDAGPALAVLLTGAGLSLPGLFIVARAIGWKKTMIYQFLVVLCTIAIAYIFSTGVLGDIMECACKMYDL